MPKLRKQSSEQRRQRIREAGINYHERNKESHRLRNSQRIAILRQNEEYRENERQKDRILRSLRRSGTSYRNVEREQDSISRSLHREDLDYRNAERERDSQGQSSRREDPSYRATERQRDAAAHSSRRKDSTYRQSEQQRDAEAHSLRREDPVYRTMEQTRNTLEHSLRREDFNYKENERIRDAAAHSLRREDPVYRTMEQTRNTLEHSLRREDKNYRENERIRDVAAHSLRREDPVYRTMEQTRNTLEHSLRREDINYKENERIRDAAAHLIRREDPVYRTMEQTRNTLEHSLRREDINYRENERIRDAAAHSIRREDPVYRTMEQTRNTLEHSLRREDKNYRENERMRDAAAHSFRRMDPVYRTLEQERNTLEHSIRREDSTYRQSERERDSIAHVSRRSNPILRAVEQRRNTNSRRVSRILSQVNREISNQLRNVRVRLHRMNPINRSVENERQALRSRENRQCLSPESRMVILSADVIRHTNRMLAEFNNNVKKGPTEICVCCGGLWFPNQVSSLNILNYSNRTEVFFLSGLFPSENNIYTFCNTCVKIIKSGKIPSICLSNGLHFPIIPNQLKGLTPLEERFVAPRIPFMRIVSLGYNRQCAVRGAVVNVPIQVDNMVNILPRTFNQTEVIQVHLKRRLVYNHSFMTETIRPAKVFEAIRYLVNTELYRKHEISISEEWINNVGLSDEVPFLANVEDRDLVQGLVVGNSENDVIEECNPQETLLDNIPMENVPLSRISIAPGEGKRPLDMLMDEDAEELSFPTIYCGIKRLCEASVAKIIRSEIRRYDRRCARVDKVLYSYKKLELYKIKNSISTCLRKKVGSNRHIARDMLDDNYINNLVQHDEGYHILKGIRSSPAHWEGEKKKVMAMIRQFGLPTFFITLSAAESHWPELLVILTKIVENREITEEEAMLYTTQQKYNLIRTDPITCSRYFDQRIRHLFKHFKASGGIFGDHKVIKFYWRIEFQQRGSPHVHGIYWLHNAPSINFSDSSTFPSVVSFINKFITTDSNIPEVAPYIQFQEHHHTRSCQRDLRGQTVCRFHIPYPPMSETEILLPLPENMDESDVKTHKENYNKIQNVLNAKLSDSEVNDMQTFDQFLNNDRINLNVEAYILAIRSSLKKPQIFLKRSFKDRSINAFNPNILAMQRANMDIQFILDAYACVSYIVNYINKSHRGVSRLLSEAMEEIRSGNCTVKQRLQHIGNKFISASEVSGQEASYNILGMHLSQCSSSEVYINTLHPDRRVRILKPRRELENIPGDSTDIYQTNLLDHYIARPNEMHDYCLAYFAAFYKFSKSRPSRNRRRQEEEDDYNENNDFNDENTDGKYFKLRDGSGYIYKKESPAIIRFPSFNVDLSRQNYFRALVMLYMPWHSEKDDILDKDNEESCRVHKYLIESNRSCFEKYKEGELEEILEQIQNDNRVEIENHQDNRAVTQLLDDEFRALAVPELDENINIIDVNDDNINSDENNDGVRLIRLQPLISSDSLLSSVRTLNKKQRKYLHHVLLNVVQNVKFCEYVGGGAGVGKSRLIKTIYQSISNRFNSIPGSNPDLPKVVLSAPTGKAAFGIGGATLHSLFSLPVNQYSGEIRPLSNDTVSSLSSLLLELKLLIIDEISMVGARMLEYLDARLKQIFRSTEQFGGISILVFGDLKQLPPVGDKWIFSSNTSNPYGVIAGELLWNQFKYYELTEIMRQREDREFAEALNSMSKGEMDDEQVRLIKSRVVNSNFTFPSEAIHLFWSNAEADQFNTVKLNQILNEEFESRAFDLIKTDSLSSEERTRIRNVVLKMKTSETQGLCTELKLKCSAKYMMTININTSDGLVNGATGILMEIEFHKETKKPITLWMLFSDESVGVEARRIKPHPTEALWTPIEKCVRSFQFRRNEQISIERKQFPLVLAEGITIHKSQGATYSKVVVHIRNRMSRSALYVACSRATSISGLYIVGNFIPPKPFEATDPVKIELERLQLQRALTLQHDFVHDDEYNVKLFYQNIQSFNAHHRDISTDPTIMEADILCLVETWAFPEEVQALDGYSLLSKLDCFNSEHEERSRNKKGISVYVKTDQISNINLLFKEDHVLGYSFQYIAFRYHNIYIITLYRSPSFAEGMFRLFLKQAIDQLRTHIRSEIDKILIVGDFNKCRKTDPDSITERILAERGLVSHLHSSTSSTKHGTQIDWVFSNIPLNLVNVKIYPTIHSHHDGILIAI